MMEQPHTIPCAYSQEIRVEQTTMKEQINNLVAWQAKQNGSLGRMADKVDTFVERIDKIAADQKEALGVSEKSQGAKVDALKNKLDSRP